MPERSTAQTLAALAALAFLLAGVAGFIPGVTTRFTGLADWGPDAHAQLLGLFRVSVLHNAVHLTSGVAGLALARNPFGAWLFLVGGGIAYLDLTIYGVVVDSASRANFVPVDTADNVLHLVLGAAMAVAGLLAARRPARAA